MLSRFAVDLNGPCSDTVGVNKVCVEAASRQPCPADETFESHPPGSWPTQVSFNASATGLSGVGECPVTCADVHHHQMQLIRGLLSP